MGLLKLTRFHSPGQTPGLRKSHLNIGDYQIEESLDNIRPYWSKLFSAIVPWLRRLNAGTNPVIKSPGPKTTWKTHKPVLIRYLAGNFTEELGHRIQPIPKRNLSPICQPGPAGHNFDGVD